VPECTISITSELTSQAIELHHVFGHVLPIFQGQMAEFMFGVTDWIMWAEIGPEF
jgi:hypothetical protein